ncbi:glycoside hydrolase family 28 protein [Butyrivibrio sp. YAB3001]|uniref:glycoside hydrolase family 28 protein n=1 Tax=Butyrivibrio sp. YAB3001 TaxID=1520812 RepID=UPI0008F6516B|nr:glycosyl hydrolase family 28 protein [Butyrivibrio sp. YAB3001]SFC11420.1 Polygalacturonase [Butyrivibrio sp. YAB3001]
MESLDFLLDYRTTQNSAEIFWDLPTTATSDCLYQVYVDGKFHIETSKTHASITDLSSDQSYEIEVFILYSGENSDKSIGKLTIHTAHEKKKIDITKSPYFCKGDGKKLNTEQIQQALDDCDKNSYVFIPSGTFLTGALNVHSDTEIYLDEGATLQGTDNPMDYLPKIPSRFEGHEMECYRSLLNLGNMDHNSGYNCQNVIIHGKGAIFGGGSSLAKAIAKIEGERLKEYINALGDRIKEYEKPETIASRFRGRLIGMNNCQNVWIHGLTLGFSPSWNIHFVYSDQIVTDHCTIKSQGVWNGDGWDPDSSTNSTLYACDFYTEDDSVAIKSGKNPEGNIINRPTRHIRVFDSVCHFGHGLCIGSEMSGGVDDVRLWNCDMGPTWSGIEIKATRKRGGYVKNVLVRDITASHVMMHSVGYNDDGEGAPTPPVLSDCRFERMHLLGRFLDNNAGKNEWHNCPSILLCGFDVHGYEIKNIEFKDIEMEEPADGFEDIHTEFCENVSFENMKIVQRQS